MRYSSETYTLATREKENYNSRLASSPAQEKIRPCPAEDSGPGPTAPHGKLRLNISISSQTNPADSCTILSSEFSDRSPKDRTGVRACSRAAPCASQGSSRDFRYPMSFVIMIDSHVAIQTIQPEVTVHLQQTFTADD